MFGDASAVTCCGARTAANFLLTVILRGRCDRSADDIAKLIVFDIANGGGLVGIIVLNILTCLVADIRTGDNLKKFRVARRRGSADFSAVFSDIPEGRFRENRAVCLVSLLVINDTVCEKLLTSEAPIAAR